MYTIAFVAGLGLTDQMGSTDEGMRCECGHISTVQSSQMSYLVAYRWLLCSVADAESHVMSLYR